MRLHIILPFFPTFLLHCPFLCVLFKILNTSSTIVQKLYLCMVKILGFLFFSSPGVHYNGHEKKSNKKLSWHKSCFLKISILEKSKYQVDKKNLFSERNFTAAQQRLYFLRKLKRARAPTPIMCTFYRGTIESILTSCITVWYGACNASCRKSLQRIVRAAEKIVALSIAGDPTHPTHSFFTLLPSGRRLRSLQARTSRLKDSFIHQAVRKLNSLPSLPPLASFTPRNTELWHYDPPPPPPHKLWPAPVTLCCTGMISTSSSIVYNLPLLTVW